VFAGDRLWAVGDASSCPARSRPTCSGEGTDRAGAADAGDPRRGAARSYGESNPIDAARAALPEPDLPAARQYGPSRDVRLLVDHRDKLAAGRTRAINWPRWHLHALDPAFRPAPATCGVPSTWPRPGPG
jgi:hypothetical protein